MPTTSLANVPLFSPEEDKPAALRAAVSVCLTTPALKPASRSLLRWICFVCVCVCVWEIYD